MMVWKNIDDINEADIEGYCFVDEDNLEVSVAVPMESMKGAGFKVVEISAYGEFGEDSLRIYHKDIPKLIKVLEAAYSHKD